MSVLGSTSGASVAAVPSLMSFSAICSLLLVAFTLRHFLLHRGIPAMSAYGSLFVGVILPDRLSTSVAEIFILCHFPCSAFVRLVWFQGLIRDRLSGGEVRVKSLRLFG